MRGMAPSSLFETMRAGVSVSGAAKGPAHGSIAAAVGSTAAHIGKFLVCMGLGGLVTMAWFRLDSHLVTQPAKYDTSVARVKMLDFVHVAQDEFTYTKERRLPRKPPPPDKPPPPPRVRVASPDNVVPLNIDAALPDIEMSFGEGGGPYLGQWYDQSGPQGADSDVIPIVRIEPRYPRDALLRGLEGWVQVEFTIGEDGRVSDPVVVASEPSRVFDRSAIQAILRWKFKPRFVEGRAIRRRASQIIDFKLEADI